MRAIVADDHALVREGLVAFFQTTQPGWDVDQAASLEELTSKAADGVDLVLVDLNMPGMRGAESFAAFREANPNVKLAVLTATDDRAVILECLSVGVHGYILKADATGELTNAVNTIIGGGIYVPAHLSRRCAANPLAPVPTPEKPGLTKRQRDVMLLLSKGLSTKSIARHLELGVGTVKVHLAALYRTLDVHTRMEAIVKVRQITGFE